MNEGVHGVGPSSMFFSRGSTSNTGRNSETWVEHGGEECAQATSRVSLVVSRLSAPLRSFGEDDDAGVLGGDSVRIEEVSDELSDKPMMNGSYELPHEDKS